MQVRTVTVWCRASSPGSTDHRRQRRLPFIRSTCLMLTRSKQSAIVAAAALTVGLAACSSSSTAPKPESASQLATHFDSIVGSLLAAGTIPDTSAAASVALLVETAPAYGSLDAPFTLTTTSGTQTWQGVTFE